MSLRRLSRDLRVNRKTIKRKTVFLGIIAQKINPVLSRLRPKSKVIEFDDLETFEHTKCKHLTVPIAVEFPSRWILGFRVAEMPAKGPLAPLSRKKYGRRKDDRRKVRRELFEELKHVIDPEAHIKSDENPHYVPDIAKHFPRATHRRFKGKRGCVAGQGELKKTSFDPLFRLNHTCAMLRANINRLVRKTWCTTKKREHLELHIALYVLRHNLELIQ